MEIAAASSSTSIVPPDEVLKSSLWEYAKQGLKLTKRIEKLKEDHGLVLSPTELMKLNHKFQVPKEQDAPSEDEVYMLVQEKLDTFTDADKLPPVTEIQKLLTQDNHLIPREAVWKAMKAVKQARDSALLGDTICRTGPSEPNASGDPPIPEMIMTTVGAQTNSHMHLGTELVQLLDVSALNTHKELATRFDSIAQSLLLDHHLQLTSASGTEEYDILEAEFYLQKHDCHQDPFTHGAEEQRYAGRWYFHRAPLYSGGVSKTSYRDGSRKGLDLTFGGPVTSPAFDSESTAEQTRGGILLRTLLQRSDSKVICGPSLLADEVISRSGAQDIRNLVQDLWAGDTSAFLPESSRPVQLSVRKNLDQEGAAAISDRTLYSSPRVGLDLSNPSVTPDLTHPRVIFLPKAYRYFTRPELFGDKARSHSFLGVYKHLCFSKELSETALAKEIARIMGMRVETTTKYMGHFHAQEPGDMKALKAFVGKAGKGASNSPAAFLGMMGILIPEPRPVRAKQNKLITMFAKASKQS